MLDPRLTRYLEDVTRERQAVSAHPALDPCAKLLWMRLKDAQMGWPTMLRLSQSEMADLTGVSRRNIARSLRTLQNASLIRYTTNQGAKGLVEVLGPTRVPRVMTRERA
jgi:hypothetical protein